MHLRTPSTIASVLGAEADGYCHHHQALDGLGAGVEAVGFAEDGTVEAAELPGKAFTIGVQWHPEENPADNRLFVALVQAAAQYGAEKQGPGGGPGNQS